MCALQEAKAWAMRTVWLADNKSTYGMLTYIAKHIQKIGGGNPTRQALHQLFDKIDEDPEWFPGKAEPRSGRPRALSGTKRSAIAKSAMSMKLRNEEVTYSRLVGTCPKATINPETNRPVDKKRIYDILRSECYDVDPDDPWSHDARLSRTALSDDMKVKRARFAEVVSEREHPDEWLFDNLVWSDLCNSVLPRTEQVAAAQASARKRKRGWGSKKTRQFSRNLRGRQEVLKQKGWNSDRVWWVPVLAKGKLHVEMLGEDFPGEDPAGAAEFVAAVERGLAKRFRSGPKPGVLFLDRSRVFFNTVTGLVTPEMAAAMETSELDLYWNDDAHEQPGACADVLLHETAVAWIREGLSQSKAKRPWKESRDQYAARLRSVVADCNARHDVAGLCRGLPKRLRELIRRQGDRLKT